MCDHQRFVFTEFGNDVEVAINRSSKAVIFNSLLKENRLIVGRGNDLFRIVIDANSAYDVMVALNGLAFERLLIGLPVQQSGLVQERKMPNFKHKFGARRSSGSGIERNNHVFRL